MPRETASPNAYAHEQLLQAAYALHFTTLSERMKRRVSHTINKSINQSKLDFIHTQEHCAAAHRRSVHIVNLDPAAESFAYTPEVDVRELVTADDVMEMMDLGPNGALVYCMEYLLENLGWLEVRQLPGSLDGS